MTKKITFNQYMKLQTPEAIQTRENWKALQTKRGWTEEYMLVLMKEGFKQLRKGGLVQAPFFLPHSPPFKKMKYVIKNTQEQVTLIEPDYGQKLLKVKKTDLKTEHTYKREMIAVKSEILGDLFWIDNEILMGCAIFRDGKLDKENEFAVEDWECMDELTRAQLNELDEIKKIFTLSCGFVPLVFGKPAR